MGTDTVNCRLRRCTGMLVVLLTVVVSACSFKTLYNQLDILIPEYVEGMVTLDDLLENELELRSRSLLEWHRSTQLVQYAAWLRALQAETGRLTPARARQLVAEMDGFWDALANRLDDDMAVLLPGLGAGQQAELYASIAAKNEEFREEYIEPDVAARREAYFDSTREAYESWIGTVNDDQEATIRQATNRLIDTASLRLQRREQWQDGIRDLLAERGSRQEKSLRLRAYLASFEFSKGQEMDSKTAHNKDIIIQLTVAISGSMTEKQQEHFIAKTDDYIRMLTELSEHR